MEHKANLTAESIPIKYHRTASFFCPFAIAMDERESLWPREIVENIQVNPMVYDGLRIANAIRIRKRVN